FNNIYRVCLEKIKRENEFNKTDIIFDVPLAILGNTEYKSIDCLDFIENKLRALHIDTYKLSARSIFISWLYVEVNKLNLKFPPNSDKNI
ncbi:MAG: hypothetical protein Edafosvirus45_1, partial [Edafosvirus sp.]